MLQILIKIEFFILNFLKMRVLGKAYFKFRKHSYLRVKLDNDPIKNKSNQQFIKERSCLKLAQCLILRCLPKVQYQTFQLNLLNTSEVWLEASLLNITSSGIFGKVMCSTAGFPIAQKMKFSIKDFLQ